jgi:hypothetical protein
VGLVTAVVIGSIWSYRSYPSDPDAAAARSFVATARIALSEAPAGTVVVDNPVPRDVTGGQHFSRRTSVSGLLGPLVSGSGQARPRFIPRPDGTYAHLMEFDGWGRLVPAVISGAASPPLAAGKSCLAVRQGTLVVRLTSVARHARYLRIGYLAGSAARLTIEFAGRIYGYTVRRGLQAAVLPVTGSGRVVIIETLSGKVPCIGDVRAGVLLPAGAGPAIPPLAVNG